MPEPLAYPLTYKVEVSREDMGFHTRFWCRLTSVRQRAQALRAIDDAIMDLGKLRSEIALAGVAEEDR